ncbi:NnrU family protein [Sulfitobacter sp. LCG007]
MIILLLGLLLWWFAHLFGRLFPERRAAMGNAGRGVVALALLLSVVLMIWGYRVAEFVPIWEPPLWMIHVNNLLMVVALWTFGSSQSKGAKAWPASRIRHPQLTAVKIWALAHLLVNGDLAAIILFGGLLAWAVVEVIVINRSEPVWTPPPAAGTATYIRLAAITVVLLIVIGYIHIWLGHYPFPG